MIIRNQYALFDWDNTVRNGYTLYSWVEYLCAKSVVDAQLLHTLNRFKNMYRTNLITHDQYAYIACSEYAKSLKGLHKKNLESVIQDYITYDKRFLYESITALFEFLHKKNIDIIVVSGAPSIILERYKNEFHLKSIYAFKEKTINNIFTGEVQYNYGFDKRKKVLELIKKYKSYPLVAFGDSESDIPMLDYASNAICVNNALINENYININPNCISIKKLCKIVKIESSA